MQKVELEGLIVKLLSKKKEITIHEVLLASQVGAESPSHKRAIQRVFKGLIDRGLIQPHGNARARSYALAKIDTDATKSVFKGIPLSEESSKLLAHVSQPIQARTPVGYNQDFLKSYQPNQDFYLNESQRTNLLSVGQVESVVRLAGTYARNILNRLLIDLSWNSSRLEGNTYSLLETKRLIEFGESAEGKAAFEAQMILNHKGAIEYIVESAEEKEISSHEVRSIHALLSEGLLGDPGASGRVRKHRVGISGTVYIPIENPHTLQECFSIFISKLNQIKNPFEQSLFALVHLSYLQAFEDVNKRTSRLVANIPLIKNNLNPLSFIDVDQEVYVQSLLGVYEKNDISLLRDLYIWAYQRSSHRYSAVQQSMGDVHPLRLKHRPFIKEMIQRVILEKTAGSQIVRKIKTLIEELNLPVAEASELFKIIEIEVQNLHDGNIARFKIRPSEFQAWKKAQIL